MNKCAWGVDIYFKVMSFLCFCYIKQKLGNRDKTKLVKHTVTTLLLQKIKYKNKKQRKGSVPLLWHSIKMHFIKAATLKDSEKEAESSGLPTLEQ